MNADPIKTMLQASQNGPYEPILEAVRQLDAGRPTHDMHQWTSLASNYDAGWLTRQNKRVDAEIREVLKLHPAWPVIEAIEAGLAERAERIKEQTRRAEAIEILARPTRDYQKAYPQKLADMAYELEAHIAQLDRMDFWALIPARRALATAQHEIHQLLSESKQEAA